MRKRVIFTLCIALALLSACIPAGKTLDDYMPVPSSSVWLAPQTTPAAVALPAPIISPAQMAFEPLPVDEPSQNEAAEPAPVGVQFADEAFENAVREYLSKPGGLIVQDELDSIEQLYVTTYSNNDDDALYDACVVYNAARLDDIELFTGVRHLMIEGFDSFSLKSAASLPLEQLQLFGCVFTDLDALAFGRSSGLSTLEMYQCTQLDDLAPVALLKNLTSLECIDARVSDIAPLSSLSHLTYLNLSGNRIRDLSPVASLFRITYLDISNNFVSDLEPLSGLTSLSTLVLSNNRVAEVKPLNSLALQNLCVDANEIVNLTPLSKQKSINLLDISYNPVKNLSVLPKLTTLKALNVEGLPSKLLEALLRVPSLQYVCIDAAQAEAWMTKLESKEITVDVIELPDPDSMESD